MLLCIKTNSKRIFKTLKEYVEIWKTLRNILERNLFLYLNIT